MTKKSPRDCQCLAKRFSALQFAFWSASACYYAYIVMYLNHRGYTNSAIGAIMSLTAVIAIVSPPIWGYISDRTRSINKIIMICVFSTAVMVFILPFIKHLWAITIVMSLIAFTDSPNAPLLDSMIMQNIRCMPQSSYGGIRLWGSLGYAIAAYILGIFIDIYGTGIMFVSYSIFAILVIKILYGLPNSATTTVRGTNSECPNYHKLFKNPRFIFFLMFGALIFTPQKASAVFLPQLFNSIGGNSTDLGMALFVSAASEAPILLLGQRLSSRFKPLSIILFSSVFFVIRMLIYSFTYVPWLAIINQLTQGLSFGLFLVGTVYYINEIAPEGLKATAQTTAAACYLGVSGILGSYLGGVVIDHYEIHTMYKIGIVIQIAATAVFSLSLLLTRHKANLLQEDRLMEPNNL